MEYLCSKLLFWHIFFKNLGCVFSRSNTILAISEELLVQLIWNEKEVHRLDTGYNMWPWFWPHSWPWPWMFQDQIWKKLYLRSCWCDWCEMKRKRIYRILGWLCDLALWSHLDLGVSRSESEIAFSQEWDGQLTWKKKDVMVSGLSYLYNGNPYTWKNGTYIETKPRPDLTTLFCMFDRQYYPSVHPSLGLHLLKLAKIQIYLDRHTEARTHLQQVHDDSMLCKCFLHNWPIVRGIHQWLLNSPRKGPVTFVTGIHQWLVDSPHKGASIAELWYLLCL